MTAASSWRIDAILPTYNRVERLRDALARHAELVLPKNVQYRLIVVDNNSDDDTAKAVADFAERCPFSCLYVFEGRQGLSHARNAGLRRANADLIAFIDDDCYPSSDWLQLMAARMSRADAPGLLGGSALLFDPADLPITIVTDPEPRRLSTADLFEGIAGLNFCFPANLVDEVGEFDTCLGAGSSTRSGEDIDFFYRVMLAGFPVDYDPALKVYHHHGRRSPEDKQKLMDGYLLGRGAFYMKFMMRLDGHMWRKAYWECRSLLLDRIKRGNPSSLHYLGVLAKGAFIYPWCRIRAALSRASSRMI